jgi:hypothetical protein
MIWRHAAAARIGLIDHRAIGDLPARVLLAGSGAEAQELQLPAAEEGIEQTARPAFQDGEAPAAACIFSYKMIRSSRQSPNLASRNHHLSSEISPGVGPQPGARALATRWPEPASTSSGRSRRTRFSGRMAASCRAPCAGPPRQSCHRPAPRPNGPQKAAQNNDLPADAGVVAARSGRAAAVCPAFSASSGPDPAIYPAALRGIAG